MSLSIPAAGDDIDATWGAGIALLNQGIVLDADKTTSSGSFASISGLAFPVVDTRSYTVVGTFLWSNSTNTGGPVFSWTDPGGTTRMLTTYRGESALESINDEQTTADDTGSGVATANAADILYFATFVINHRATASGTFQMRWKRNTAGTTTLYAGSAIQVMSSDTP